MSPKELVLVLLVCDLEKVFLKYYLKGLDYNDELTITAHNLILDFARKMKDEFDAAETEKFNSSITQDRNGKIVAYVQVSDSTHEILLISNHLSVRNACAGKIETIQDLREKLKKSIVSHIISTVTDQSQKGILLEFEAAFNMVKSINSSTRISYIKELCTTDRLNYTHKIK